MSAPKAIQYDEGLLKKKMRKQKSKRNYEIQLNYEILYPGIVKCVQQWY